MVWRVLETQGIPDARILSKTQNAGRTLDGAAFAVEIDR